jgi:Uncharacterized conserved protein (DUF2267)
VLLACEAADIHGAAQEDASFALEELYRRVAEREGVDIETARIDASAVMRELREAVSPPAS